MWLCKDLNTPDMTSKFIEILQNTKENGLHLHNQNYLPNLKAKALLSFL